jgi:hypothetical protein
MYHSISYSVPSSLQGASLSLLLMLGLNPGGRLLPFDIDTGKHWTWPVMAFARNFTITIWNASSSRLCVGSISRVCTLMWWVEKTPVGDWPKSGIYQIVAEHMVS